MSLSYQPLTPVLVRDPRTLLESHRSYAILKSGSQTNAQTWTTTSISNTNMQFNCPPPSPNIIVDRKVYLVIPVRLAFTAVPPVGSAVLNPNYDAPRAFPITGSIDTMSATINNTTVNMSLADMIHALMHYNTDVELAEGDYSTTPTYMDQSQQYGDLIASTRSPLGNYSNNSDGARTARGAFPFTVVQNPVQTGSSTLTAYVDCCFCEPIIIPPFYAGKSNGCGFYNVNNMQFNINFVGQVANRMWSHYDMNGTNVITTAQHYFYGTPLPGPAATQFPSNLAQQPYMLFTYITPQSTQIIPSQLPISYPCFDIPRYITNLPSVTAGSQFSFTSQSMTLNAVPRRIYIYIRKQNLDLWANAANTDTFFQINSLSIQFMNNSGLLASATMSQLYQMSRKNHCNMSWEQWSGGPVNTSVAAFAGAQIGTIGSIVCLELATDIGLPDLMAPGLSGQVMLQIAGTATNVASSTINPTMYVIPVMEEVFTITGSGSSQKQQGVITPQDILDAQSNPAINYADVEDVRGGDFWTGLKSFGAKLLPYLEMANNLLKSTKIISNVASRIPHPVAQSIGQAANMLGYGEGGDGGVLLGGRRLGRHSLHQRMAKY